MSIRCDLDRHRARRRSPDSIAARIASEDRTLDHFLLLNGLDKSTPLTAGESYKLVID